MNTVAETLHVREPRIMPRHAAQQQVVLHHVGGRGGSRSFPVLPAFEAEIVNVLYEADAGCVSQVAARWRSQPSTTMVLPYCLGAREGHCTFHMNYDPNTSSVYSINPRYAPFYYVQSPQGYDYVLGDTVRTMSAVGLTTTTLDAVVFDRGEAPSPDFLSMDTQGSELEILKGAARALQDTILAVQVEVEFHPLYQGQALFGELCGFLADRGFDLVDVRLFGKKYPMRGKQGFRGEGYVTDGDALFLRRPDTIGVVGDGRGGPRLQKLAFIATVYGRFECAQQCFEAPGFERLSAGGAGRDQGPRYLAFVSRLADAVMALPARSIPLFSDRFTYEQSQARFEVRGAPRRSAMRRHLAAIAPMAAAVRGMRAAAATVSRLRDRLQDAGRAVEVEGRWRLRRPGSPVEGVLREFGMKEQFELAARNRIQDGRQRSDAGRGRDSAR